MTKPAQAPAPKPTPKWMLLARVLAFVLLAALLLAAAGSVLAPKSDITAAFYAEPKNTVDLLFVGGSHAAAAFDPTQLWQQQGAAGYTLYSWGQPAWASYHYVAEALKTQSPQVVVVEGFGFMYGRSYLEEGNFDDVSDDFSLRIRPGLNRLQLAMAMAKWQQAQRPFYRYAPLLRYHSRWNLLTADDFLWPFQDHSTTGKGFGPVFGTEAFPPQAPPDPIPENTLYPGCEEYLYNLIELSQKQGFQLIIAMAPYVIEQPGEWGVFSQIERICAENGVAFLNYNAPELQAECGFSFETDMAEHAHVNLYGADKITRHIGNYLAQNTALPNRQNDDAYAARHQAAAIESWDLAKMRLRMSPTAASWLPRLKQENLAAVLVGNFSSPQNPEGMRPLAEGLAALGLDAAPLEQGGSCLAVLEDGRVSSWQTATPGQALQAECTLAGLSLQLSASAQGCTIQVNGTQRALHYPEGLHALVIDKTDGSIVQVVVFQPGEAFLTRTD